jgi:hypothetical protein
LVFIYRSLPIGGSGGLIIEPFFVAVLYIVMNFVPIVISFMALALSLVKAVLDLMVAFAKVILNVSSAPENSPFTYLASLLSLTAAGGKLSYEAVK